MATNALAMYKDLYENYLAVPAIAGVKSESERFAGADQTYTVEGLMQDGKALQMCTSHVLAQSFPASFDVNYQDKDGTVKVPHCTSWGFTTRSVGALIMTHGDGNGLIMPPRVAPIQVVIVPIFKTDEERTAILAKVRGIKKDLDAQGVRCVLDDDETKTPGAKFFHWELRGVPVRVEMGPKDLVSNNVVLVNRIETDKAKKKSVVSADNLVSSVTDLLQTIQNNLLQRARDRMRSQWHQADKLATFGPQMDANGGLYQTGWCGSPDCEAKVKEFKGTIRCLLDEKQHSTCMHCTQPSKTDILVAKAY